jgi:hypothetical protein
MSLVPLVAVGTLVFTVVNFLTFLTSHNWNAAITQLIAWTAGVVGIILAAHTQYASQISFGTQKLSEASWPTQVFLGLIATSLLSTVNEIKKAIDGTDSAAKAPLVPSLAPSNPAVPAVASQVAQAVTEQVAPAVASQVAQAVADHVPPAVASQVAQAVAEQVPPAAANQGVVALVGGSVTVAHQAVRPDSRILLQALGNQQGSLRVTDRQESSFTITSTNPSDVGPVAYQILGP